MAERTLNRRGFRGGFGRFGRSGGPGGPDSDSDKERAGRRRLPGLPGGPGRSERQENSERPGKSEKRGWPSGGISRSASRPFRSGGKKSLLPKEIAAFGFEYSLKKYAAQSAVILAAMAVIGHVYMLSVVRLVILIAAALAAYPLILRAQLRFLAAGRDFREAAQYMEQMLLFFKQTPKILSAMKGTMMIAEGQLRERLRQAVFIIEHDVSGADVYEKAFGLLEEAYPSARIKTLHRFMLQVERGSSGHYQQGADSLYFDTQSWVSRVYGYQKEMKNIKAKLSVIMVMSVGIAAFFSRMLLRAEESLPGKLSLNLVDSALYQNAAVVFLLLFLALYVFVQAKVTGRWLLDDTRPGKDQDLALHAMDAVEHGNPRREYRKAAAASLVGFGMAAASAIVGFKIGAAAGAVLGVLILSWPRILRNKRRSLVETTLRKDFPVWMREVSIHLYDMVPVRAASLEPYLHVFRDYHVEELTASFKSLFTIRSLSSEDAQRQVTELVRRNQSQLEKAERLRNQDYLSGVSLISLLPMVLMSLYLIVNLLLILLGFMGLAKGAF